MIRYAVLALLLFACGPSSQEIKSAKGARYRGNINDMLDIAIDSTKQAGYEVSSNAISDFESGFLTQPHWYQYGGQAESHGRASEYHGGSLLVGFLVYLEHVDGTRTLIRLNVLPVVKRSLDGQVLKPDDPWIPSWVTDKANEIWTAAHKNLAKFEVRGP